MFKVVFRRKLWAYSTPRTLAMNAMNLNDAKETLYKNGITYSSSISFEGSRVMCYSGECIVRETLIDVVLVLRLGFI